MSHALFLKGYSANLRIIIFALLSFTMMTADHRYGHLEQFRASLSILIYPLQYAANLPVTFTRWASQSLTTRAQLIKENAQLHSEKLMLGSRLQKLENLEAENQRLRRMLHSAETFESEVLIAELLAINLQPLRQQIIINKGGRNEVYNGQPIIDAYGVMGQVTHVNLLSSTVLLITDPAHAIPVQVNRNGLHAIAVGTGQSHILKLQYLPNSVDIKQGDLLISSGLGGKFPPGYPVGVVSEIKRTSDSPFAEVSLTPSARIGNSREVLLVWDDRELMGAGGNQLSDINNVH